MNREFDEIGALIRSINAFTDMFDKVGHYAESYQPKVREDERQQQEAGSEQLW